MWYFCKITIKTKVLAFGTFDYFHEGHKKFLSDAKKLGDELFILVARDENVKNIKGFFPDFSEKERLEAIKKWDNSLNVFLGDKKDKFKVLKDKNPDIIALGFDQNANEKKIKEILPKVKIIRLSPYFPQKFKSSIIRKKWTYS